MRDKRNKASYRSLSRLRGFALHVMRCAQAVSITVYIGVSGLVWRGRSMWHWYGMNPQTRAGRPTTTDEVANRAGRVYRKSFQVRHRDSLASPKRISDEILSCDIDNLDIDSIYMGKWIYQDNVYKKVMTRAYKEKCDLDLDGAAGWNFSYVSGSGWGERGGRVWECVRRETEREVIKSYYIRDCSISFRY